MTTMETYLIVLSMLITDLIAIAVRLNISKKNPPYISGGDLNRDTISVFCYFILTRNIRYYREFVFVKRNNGKYKMRFKALDWFNMLLSWFLSLLSLFIIFAGFGIDYIIGKPDGIPALIFFFLFLFLIFFFPNYSQMEARMYFKKTMNKTKD